MTRLTYAQKQAFGDTVAQFVREHATELRRAGFDPAKKLAALEASVKSAVDLDVEQETLKAELVKTTDEAVNAIHSCYRQASSMIDTMAGIFGKGSPLAKRLRKLREQMSNIALRGKRVVPRSEGVFGQAAPRD